MQIISLNVGTPHLRQRGDGEVLTGGDKSPVASASLYLHGFEGDGQADTVNHGGADKAVCVYSSDHYPYWERVLGHRLEYGAFSENLTVAGLNEQDVCIGDVFRAGTALVQVSQPRTPCGKLAGKHKEPQLAQWVADANYTGFYLRVLEEGTVSQGVPFELVQAHPARISIAAVDNIIFDRSSDLALIAQLVSLPEFGESGRRIFAGRLARLTGQV